MTQKAGYAAVPSFDKQIQAMLSLFQTGQYAKALEMGESLEKHHPDVPLLENILGAVHGALGHKSQCLNRYRAALSLKPDYVDAHNNLGSAYLQYGHPRQAIDSFQQALICQPEFAIAHYNLANALRDVGRFSEAIAEYERAQRLQPDNPNIYNNLAAVHRFTGNTEDAIACYEQAIAKAPRLALAHRNLSLLKTYQPTDDHLQQMLELASAPGVSEADLMQLSFALGKAFEDLEEQKKSFSFYKQGNDLRRQQLHYHIDLDRQLFRRIYSLAERPCREIAQSEAPGRTRPILIVGMPRSGTTLVEAILGSHPDATGAGELNLLHEGMKPMLTSQGNVADLTANLKVLRRHYLDGIEALSKGSPVIVDKMPGNFRWLGFLLKAVPEAKIIHMRRDPIATCWSNFKHFFTSSTHGYSCSLQDLAQYFNLYKELMDYWRRQFPGRIYDCHYEALTEQPEELTRALLEHCQLDWDDNCLKFHEREHNVQTASANQIRQPIYRGSSEAWRKFEAQLEPLIQLLKADHDSAQQRV